MIESYNPDERFKNDFANKIIDVMEEKLRKTDLKNKDYEKVFQWVKRSECWVELYRNKITEFIGWDWNYKYTKSLIGGFRSKHDSYVFIISDINSIDMYWIPILISNILGY